MIARKEMTTLHSSWKAIQMPRWVWLFVIAALIWSWSLYFVGWLLTPKGYRYFWLVPLYPADCNAHLAWARQAFEGKSRFADTFTTEKHDPKTFNFHDWFVGILARWLRIPLHLSMWLVHTIGVIAFVHAAWWLAAPILTESQQRTYMLMLCFLGGFICLGMPEANTFIALATTSWIVWGEALAALLMGSIVRIWERNGKNFGFFGMASGMLLGNIRPYALAPICCGLALWFILNSAINRRLAKHTLFSALIALPAILTAALQAITIFGDPVYQAAFNIPFPAPPIWYFVLNYGAIILLALLASIHLLRKPILHNPKSLHIMWFIGAFISVYFTPTMLDRRLIEGVHLPMCILAALGWHEIVLTLPRMGFIRRYPMPVLILIGGIAPLSFWVFQVDNIFLHSKFVHTEFAPHKGVPLYISEHHLQLIDWLANNSKPDEAILCSYELGNYIPVLTGRRVFIGHWNFTINLHKKFKTARKIWRGELKVDEAKAIFQKHRLRYALETIYERHATKTEHNPNYCPYLPEHFHLSKYGDIVLRVGNNAIYRLRW